MRLNCEGSATSSRRVRDTRDDFAIILRGILSHKIFEHVQNFRDYFAPLGDTCEEITNHWRLFRDCFATHSRCLLPAVAKQLQSSEIGALLTTEFVALEHLKIHFHHFIQIFLKLADNQDWHTILCFCLISFWSLFQAQSYLPLSIIKNGISKHYAGSQASDRRPLGNLF